MTRILRPPVRALPLRADLVRLVLELAQDPPAGSHPWPKDGRSVLGPGPSPIALPPADDYPRGRRRRVILVTITSVSGPGIRQGRQRQWTAVYDDIDRSTHPRTARRPLVDNGNGQRMPVRRAIAAAAGGRLSSSGGWRRPVVLVTIASVSGPGVRHGRQRVVYDDVIMC